jgi:hypothetical protein
LSEHTQALVREIVVVIQEAEAIPEAILEQTAVVISETQELPHTSEPTQERLPLQDPRYPYSHTKRKPSSRKIGDRTRPSETGTATEESCHQRPALAKDWHESV